MGVNFNLSCRSILGRRKFFSTSISRVLLISVFFVFFTDFALLKLKGFFNNEGRQL